LLNSAIYRQYIAFLKLFFLNGQNSLNFEREDASVTIVASQVPLLFCKLRIPLKDMVELFAPLRGLNIDFERDRDAGQDIQSRRDI
jgi:hypothetical protein